MNLREKLRAVGIALLTSVTVGACQAIYFLLNLPFVDSSREFKSISTLPAHQLTGAVITDLNELAALAPEADVFRVPTPQSHRGMRAAYHAFCVSQIEAKAAIGRRGSPACEVSFTALMSNYNVKKATKTHLDKYDNPPPLLTMKGTTCCVVPVAVRGVRKQQKVNLAAENFTLEVDNQKIAFTRYKVGEQRVLVLNPYFTVNMADERACFSTLLLHLPWNIDGEMGLLKHPITQQEICAVEAFKYHNEKKAFPSYVQYSLQKVT